MINLMKKTLIHYWLGNNLIFKSCKCSPSYRIFHSNHLTGGGFIKEIIWTLSKIPTYLLTWSV